MMGKELLRDTDITIRYLSLPITNLTGLGKQEMIPILVIWNPISDI